MNKTLTDDERISATVHLESQKALAILKMRIERLSLIAAAAWSKPTERFTSAQHDMFNQLCLAVSKCEVACGTLDACIKTLAVASHELNLHFYQQLCLLSQALDKLQTEFDAAEALLATPQTVIGAHAMAQRSMQLH
jgi:hypothetical protein